MRSLRPAVSTALLFGGILAAAPLVSETVDVTATVVNTFMPRDVIVLVGDNVRWTRQTKGFHNMVADDGTFRCASGCDQTGGNGDASNTWNQVSFQFVDPDFELYHCEVHGFPGGGGMSGTVKVLRAIFGDGFEGGASDDQWAPLIPLGDSCSTPVDVPSDVGGLASTLAGALNDSDLTFGASCLSSAAHGRDRVFKLTVAPGSQVTATATPVGGDLDLAVYLVPSAQCDLLATLTCLDGADVNFAGQPETVSYTNANPGTEEVYLFVDSLSAASAGGAFTLSVIYDAF